MKKVLFSVYDFKTKTFSEPNSAFNDEDAIRSVISAIGVVDNFQSHPEDFEITKLGEFDNQTGEITSEIKTLCTMKQAYEEWLMAQSKIQELKDLVSGK